jgi:hypothetical protein
MVSRGGGVQARWRRDGKELFYISPDWKMMAVDVSTRPTFHSGEPHPLFDTHMVDTGIRTGPISWDISSSATTRRAPLTSTASRTGVPTDPE